MVSYVPGSDVSLHTKYECLGLYVHAQEEQSDSTCLHCGRRMMSSCGSNTWMHFLATSSRWAKMALQS